MEEWFVPTCDVDKYLTEDHWLLLVKYSSLHGKRAVKGTYQCRVYLSREEVRILKRQLRGIRFLPKEEAKRHLSEVMTEKRLEQKERELRNELRRARREEARTEQKRRLEQELHTLKLAISQKDIRKKTKELEEKIKIQREIKRLKEGIKETELDDTIPDWSASNWGVLLSGNLMKYTYSDRTSDLTEINGGPAELRIMPKPFAQGTFRNAFYSTLNNGPRISKTLRVLDAGEKNTCIEDITTLSIAQMYAEKFNARKPKKIIRFATVVLFELDEPWNDAHYISVEEQLEGKFEKYNNNGSFVNSKNQSRTAQAFSHFTHHISGGSIMITDIQGTKLPDNSFLFTDPAIHSRRKLYGDADCGERGMKRFFESHACNAICRTMALPASPYQKKAYDPSDTVLA